MQQAFIYSNLLKIKKVNKPEKVFVKNTAHSFFYKDFYFIQVYH